MTAPAVMKASRPISLSTSTEMAASAARSVLARQIVTAHDVAGHDRQQEVAEEEADEAEAEQPGQGQVESARRGQQQLPLEQPTVMAAR